MRKSNLTYEEVIELAPKDRPFQIEVIFSAVSKFPISYWANMFNSKKLKTFWLEDFNWEEKYKGTFTLIDEYRNMYKKPEVLEVGTEVEILEDEKVVETGKIYWVYRFDSGIEGLHYDVELNNENNVGTFPHYCVRPVEKVEEKVEEMPEIEDTINQLDNLFTQVQDIISNYKK
jgi:hypothetical protein